METITGNEFFWAWVSGIRETVRKYRQKSEVKSLLVTIGIMVPIIIVHFIPADIALMGGLGFYLVAVPAFIYKAAQYCSLRK